MLNQFPQGYYLLCLCVSMWTKQRK